MRQAYSRESDVELAIQERRQLNIKSEEQSVPGDCIAQLQGHYVHIIQHKFHPLELCNVIDQSPMGASKLQIRKGLPRRKDI